MNTLKPHLWKGPQGDGITNSLLNRFYECRERFRLLVCEGIKDIESYNTYMEFGNMWHAAEEVFASGKNVGTKRCTDAAHAHMLTLEEKYPADHNKIHQDYTRAKTLWPLYVQHWRQHPDVRARTPLFQEESFRVTFRLRSGRLITMRGKFDSVDIIDNKLYLQENKTKSRIDSPAITATLDQNIQTMIYIKALQAMNLPHEIGGVRYNVVYNSNHAVGGKQTTDKQYRERVLAEPNKFFMRWRVELRDHDITEFFNNILNNILEQLMDWWEWITSIPGRIDPFANPIHYQTPWGTYNSLAGGWRGSYYDYLTTGNKATVFHTDNLFPEL